MFVGSDNFNSVNPCPNDEPETSLNQLMVQLPQFDRRVIEGLINISRGQDGGSMKTVGLVKCVKEDQVYQIEENMIISSNELFAIDLEEEASNPSVINVPEHLEFFAEWDKNIIASGENNNILGDNGGLYFAKSLIQIPKVKATNENLAYYGALLIPEKSAIRFPKAPPFPLWKMHVETNYVKDYIMSENDGGGFYLEYHNDQPHFHMVLEGGGYYLLAKQTNTNTFHISAFEISSGQAIYTKKGAIHCDAALIGDLIVGYTTSNECSTVLLRTKNNKMVEIEFV